MRIIGYVEHPVMKITIFKMDDKRAVKFEAGLLEQTYKFRTFDGFSTLEDIQKWVDSDLLQAVEKIFAQMSQQKSEALLRILPVTVQEEFEEII
jgi:uncharacterized protein YifN (PemK superfamily)